MYACVIIYSFGNPKLLMLIRSMVTLALTLLTSSQAILIVWSKRAGKYEYSVTTANFLVKFELNVGFNFDVFVKFRHLTVFSSVGGDFEMCIVACGLGKNLE